MATMTKNQLVRHLAQKTGTNNKTAAALLDNFTQTAIKETKKNGVFSFIDIGKIIKANRKARMGRNPQTGQAIRIPAKTVVKFRMSKSAKDALAGR
jgi:DNA-binding protein HU-beta